MRTHSAIGVMTARLRACSWFGVIIKASAFLWKTLSTGIRNGTYNAFYIWEKIE